MLSKITMTQTADLAFTIDHGRDGYALGVTEEEYREANGSKGKIDWPK